MKRSLRYSILLATAVVASQSAQAKVTFEDDLYPILRNRCNKCHNSNDLKGNLDLSTFQGVLRGGGSGEVVNSGDPDGSKLLLVVTHDEEPTMPPNAGKIPENEIKVFKEWIAGGLLETSGSKKIDARKPKFDLAVSSSSMGKPEGPAAMPKDLLLEPVVKGLRPTAVRSMASSPWASLVAMTGQKQVLIYNTDSLELNAVIPFEEGFPNDLKFSRNGKLLLVAGGYPARIGLVNVYDVETGVRVISVGDDFDSVQAADISADQRWIALGGPDRLIKVYSTSTGEKVHEMKKHTDWLTAVEFSPDGKLLATGDRAGNLFVWDSASGENLYNLKGHRGAVKSVSWRADSSVLLSGSEDATLKLWNVGDEEQIKSWTGHGGGVQFAKYGMNGNIISAGRDNKHTLWDASGKRLKSFNTFADVGVSAVLSHDGKRVIGADWTGDVGVWNAADAKLIGKLDSNPPFIDERLALMTAGVTKKEEALKAAEAAAAKVRTKVTGVQKTANDLLAESSVQQTRSVATQAGAMLASLEKNTAPSSKVLAGKVAGAEKTSASKKTLLDQAKAKLAATDKISAQWRKVSASLTKAQAGEKAAATKLAETKKTVSKETSAKASIAKAYEKLQGELKALGEEAEGREELTKKVAAKKAELAKATKAEKESKAQLAATEKAVADSKKQVASLSATLKKTAKDNPEYAKVAKLVADAEAAYKASNGTLAGAKKELAAFQSANKKATDGLKQAKAAAEALITSLEKTDSVHHQWVAKSKELEGAKAELTKAEAARKSAGDSLTSLEQSIAFWKAAEFNVQVIAERKLMAQISLEVESAKLNLASLDRELVSLGSELKKIDKQIASNPDQIQGHQNVIKFAETWVKDAAAAVAKTEGDLKNGSAATSKALAAFEKAREATELASQKVDKMKAMRKQVAIADKNKSESENVLGKANDALKKARTALQKSEKAIADLKAKPEAEQGEDHKKALAAAEAKAAEATKALAKAQKKSDDLDAVHQKVVAKMDDLKQAYASAQGDTAEKMANQASKSEESAKSALDKSKAAVERLKKTLASAKATLKTEQAGLTAAQADLKKAQALASTLPEKRKETQARLAAAQKELAAFKTSLVESEKKLVAQTAKVEQMTKRYQAMKKGDKTVQNAGL